MLAALFLLASALYRLLLFLSEAFLGELLLLLVVDKQLIALEGALLHHLVDVAAGALGVALVLLSQSLELDCILLLAPCELAL